MFEIIDITPEGKRFLDEWENSLPYITAHTSGSTGRPKEIHLSKDDMRVSASSTNARFGIDASSCLFLPLSADYIAGKMMIVRAIEAGCRLIMETPSGAPLKTDIGMIDLMAAVPSQCGSLTENESARRSLRNLIVGGAPMTKEQEDMLSVMPWRTFATYGMTETCSHVALRAVGTETYEAMPGITFSSDERGCLVIHAEKYSFRQLTTNDIVDLTDDRHFRWCGRADNVINSGGIKFSPEELEKLLENRLPAPFFIHGAGSEKWGECIELVTEADPSEEGHILDVCRKVLPRYGCPRQVLFVKTLPRTANGKLRRR